MGFELRTCADSTEFEGALMAIGQYFGMEPGDESSQRFAKLLPLDRMHGVWDGAQVVAGAGSFPFTLSVSRALRRCSGTRRSSAFRRRIGAAASCAP